MTREAKIAERIVRANVRWTNVSAIRRDIEAMAEQVGEWIDKEHDMAGEEERASVFEDYYIRAREALKRCSLALKPIENQV